MDSTDPAGSTDARPVRAHAEVTSTPMRAAKADKLSDYGCERCEARLVRHLHLDGREDLWCARCNRVRGLIVPGRGAAGSILPWDERAGGVQRGRAAHGRA